jgi:lysophospholipase L1-like esterase
MKTIVCFGDSNTWGTNPFDWTRYPIENSWPGVLSKRLGKNYRVIEEGLPGRTTVWEDPLGEHRSGKEYLLPCLLSHQPIDLVVLMLGTNDLKVHFHATAEDIAAGAGMLVQMIQNSKTGPGGGAPLVLLIAPPPILEVEITGEMFANGAEKSKKFGHYFARIANEHGCAYLDAGEIIQSHPNDGIHLGEDAHQLLGLAIAEKILLL